MGGEPVPTAAGRTTAAEQTRRWAEVVDLIAGILPPGAGCIVVDGGDGHGTVLTERLAGALHARGRPYHRLTGAAPPTGSAPPTDAAPPTGEDAWPADRVADTVVLFDGAGGHDHPPAGRWRLAVGLRTGRGGPAGGGGRRDDADIVIDLSDPAWPVIRHLDPRLAARDRWHLTESRAFFAARAAAWDTRYGDDLPAYTAAVSGAGFRRAGVALDVGCGTGRALPALRDAVGPAGTVIGLDLTPHMLAVAQARGRRLGAGLVLADAGRLPLSEASVDAVFAAGLLNHLTDADAGLRELARVTRRGGRLVLFHPCGRAALAARHGRTLRPDEPLAELPLRRSTARTGWHLISYDDAPDRFLAIAVRA
jgi:SAM-dependent methyltransferase